MLGAVHLTFAAERVRGEPACCHGAERP
jgi:hypothetical protein